MSVHVGNVVVSVVVVGTYHQFSRHGPVGVSGYVGNVGYTGSGGNTGCRIHHGTGSSLRPHAGQ